MNVFNRATQVFWGDRQDPFQECTDGLQGLFINADPDEMADRLAETLIKPDLPADPKGAKRHLTLNLIPSDTAPADFLLHEPKARASLPSFDHQRRGDQHSSKKVYKYDCGTIYGNLSKSVRNDDTREKRKDVKLALELQAEEAHAAECIARGEAPPEGRFDREWRERQDIWDREKRERKRKWNKPKIKVFKRPRTSVDDVAAAAANEHSKAFAVGKAVVREDSESLDDRTAMFVRMPVDGWEEMRYGVASAASSSVQVRRRVGAGVLDLLEAEEMSQAERGESTQSQSQSPSQPTVDANHDVKPSAAQLAGNRKPTPAQFASADRKPTPAQLAVAEKKPTRIQLASTDPTQSSQPSSVPSSQPFERAAKPNPFKPTQSHNPFATKPSGAAVNPFRSKESAGVPYGTVTPLKSDPTSSQSATPLSRSAAPFSSPTAKPSVTPLATRPESALKPAAESGTMPLSKPTQSVKPTRSNPFKSTPKATPTPSKSTQTKLNFLTKK
jgi:hypothetical protein